MIPAAAEAEVALAERDVRRSHSPHGQSEDHGTRAEPPGFGDIPLSGGGGSEGASVDAAEPLRALCARVHRCGVNLRYLGVVRRCALHALARRGDQRTDGAAAAEVAAGGAVARHRACVLLATEMAARALNK